MSGRLIFFVLLSGLIACSSTKPQSDTVAQEKVAQEKVAQEKPPGQVVDVSGSVPHEKGVGRTDIQYVEVSATVKSVNVKKRNITVIGPDRRPTTFDVDPAVKRLSEIKPGDKVVLQYFQSLAFEVREPTAEERKSPKTITEAAARNPKELPPAMGAARSVHAIVTIEAIDRTKQTVTVKGPAGRVVEVQVMEPKNLDKIKLGDTVAVTYTEGLAVGIDPAS